MMDIDRQIWRSWSEALHRWGVKETAATLLESFGPLTLLGAQAVYFCQPLFQHGALDSHLQALSQMLEDSEETKAFVTYLREGTTS
jgi:hypothetical protein